MGRGEYDCVADRGYDEAIPVETDDEELSTPGSSEAGSPTASSAQQSPPAAAASKGLGQAAGARGGGGKARQDDGDSPRDDGGESSSSEESTSESEDGTADKGNPDKSANPPNAYNPDDFKGLKVTPDMEELFQYITRYKPHDVDLDTSLKPFVPELIPSIGEVDAFLKMPRPDGEPSHLGTSCLDEPTMNPSDPSILDLQLRSLSKSQDLEPREVRSIELAEKNPKEVENWVKRIDDLNRQKPAPTVQYSRRMPDIEQLMQIWPAEFEEYLQNNPLPELMDMDLDLPSLIKILASVLDVPVHTQLTESLHVIFTLYSEFKSNQHFSKTDTAGNFGGADPYKFDRVPNFAAGPPGSHGPQAFFGGASGASMAPSRAPSPVR